MRDPWPWVPAFAGTTPQWHFAISVCLRLLFRRFPAAKALDAAAAFLRFQPLLARSGGRASLAAQLRRDAGAAHELDESRERILPVAHLGAVPLRLDDEHALSGDAAAGHCGEPAADRLRQ